MPHLVLSPATPYELRRTGAPAHRLGGACLQGREGLELGQLRIPGDGGGPLALDQHAAQDLA
jgi:hypothetical protein